MTRAGEARAIRIEWRATLASPAFGGWYPLGSAGAGVICPRRPCKLLTDPYDNNNNDKHITARPGHRLRPISRDFTYQFRRINYIRLTARTPRYGQRETVRSSPARRPSPPPPATLRHWSINRAPPMRCSRLCSPLKCHRPRLFAPLSAKKRIGLNFMRLF